MATIKFEIPESSSVSASPQCYARFFPFKVRDTVVGNPSTVAPLPSAPEIPGILHTFDVEKAMEVGYGTDDHLDVASDILSCNVTKTKDRAAGTFRMVLAPGKIDYHAVLHPGDHVLIWMRRDRQQDPKKQFTNAFDSGLKMWGVVQAVSRQTVVDPSSGRKFVRHVIQGEDFGHFFETDIYYNSILAEKLKDQGILYLALGALVNLDFANPSDNAHILLNAYAGGDVNKGAITAVAPEVAAPNQVFRVPSPITSFFSTQAPSGPQQDALRHGRPGTLGGLLWRFIGILGYSDDHPEPSIQAPLQGFKMLQLDSFSKFTLWSTLRAYTNPTMNEMFVDLLPVGPNKLLQPSIVIRQIPYTSKAVQPTLPIGTTAFVDLPRARIPNLFILSEELQRSEQMRFNFVQMRGTGSIKGGALDTSIIQALHGNFALDTASISRYGLATMLPETDTDVAVIPFKTPARSLGGLLSEILQSSATTAPGSSSHGNLNISLVPEWTQVYADWYLRAHLLESGLFECIGIQEPINIGDNIEVKRPNGRTELHHVQTYTHSYDVNANSGVKIFRTTLSTTRGQNADETFISTERNVPSFVTNVEVP